MVVAGLIAGACSTFGTDDDRPAAPEGGGDAGPDANLVTGTPGSSNFTIQSPAGRTYLVQGQTQPAKIHVARGTLLKSAITVTLKNLPRGVTPTQVIIPAGASDIDLGLKAAADAPQGIVKVAVDGAALDDQSHAVTATSSFELFVRGPSGSTDTTFGTEGHVKVLEPPDTSVTELLVTPKDEIYVVYACAGATCITRRKADGAVDAKFGTAGVLTRNGIEPSAALVQPDGRIVTAGKGTTNRVAVFRLNADGSPDTTFGNGADGPGSFSVTPPSGTAFGANQLARGDNGSFVVSSTTDVGSNHFVARLLRLDPQGTVVATFGTNGIATWDGDTRNTAVRALSLKSSGAVLAAGVTGTTFGTSYAATQLDATGNTDTNFGTAGALSTSFSGAESLIPTHGSVAFLDGSLVFPVTGGAIGLLVKISSAGQFDSAFGVGGALELSGGGKSLAALGITRSPDGKLVVLAADIGLGGGATLFRMATNGVADTTFGSAGNIVIATAPGSAAGQVVVQSDGRILVLNNVDLQRIWN